MAKKSIVNGVMERILEKGGMPELKERHASASQAFDTARDELTKARENMEAVENAANGKAREEANTQNRFIAELLVDELGAEYGSCHKPPSDRHPGGYMAHGIIMYGDSKEPREEKIQTIVKKLEQDVTTTNYMDIIDIRGGNSPALQAFMQENNYNKDTSIGLDFNDDAVLIKFCGFLFAQKAHNIINKAAADPEFNQLRSNYEEMLKIKNPAPAVTKAIGEIGSVYAEKGRELKERAKEEIDQLKKAFKEKLEIDVPNMSEVLAGRALQALFVNLPGR